MAEKKKQHFIPRSYLNAWCDPNCPTNYDPYTWLISKDFAHAENKSPKNVMYESEFYTVNDSGNRDLGIENALKRMEDAFTNVLRNTLLARKPLSEEDHVILAIFTAAMHARTRAFREWQRSQWMPVLDDAEYLRAKIERATPEERERMASYAPPPWDDDPGLSYEDVERVVANPVQELIKSFISVEAEMLCHANLAILCTTDIPGFVTSDSPCVWFDQEGVKRPEGWRSPGFMFKSIEITLPVSPYLMLHFNRQNISDYIDVTTHTVDRLNVRTIAYSDKVFIVNRGLVKFAWHPDYFHTHVVRPTRAGRL